MDGFIWMAAGSLVAVLGGAMLLHLIAAMGSVGRGIMGWFSRAPGLDLLVTWFTVLPWLVGGIVFGWMGLLGGLEGQVVGLVLWCWGHELANRKKIQKGARIVTVLNRLVGRPRNHIALWVTALAVPLFWVVRIGEWVIYPPLIVLVKFPRYPMGEWVNVSRHKFDGLVGHDLIWCLYCDWMTGVWSLGSEMLRNVESFWCPIRFLDDKKCANCSVDFPDVLTTWAKPDGSMKDVTEILERKYGSLGKDERYTWFGHPDRVELTVEGKGVGEAERS